MNHAFNRLSIWFSRQLGRPATFFGACLLVIVWAATGPIFGWGTVWQLVINTGTTIVTFLMIFLLQASTNRGEAALHAKLDELISVNHDARNLLIGLEDKTEDEIAEVKKATLAAR